MAASKVSKMIAPLVYRQTQEKIHFLIEVPIFKGLSPLQAGKLLTHCMERNYDVGETVFAEGDLGKALFIVYEGRVQVVKQVSEEREMVLATLESGAYFGELALLDTLPRSAGVRAISPTTLLILYRSDFETLISRRADIGVPVIRQIAKTLSGQLRRTNEDLARARKDSTQEPK